MTQRTLRPLASALAGVFLLVAGCGGNETQAPAETSFRARDVADAVYAVVAGHRKIYTDLVVSRLGQAGVVVAHEDWLNNQSLLLPAQLFRLSAEEVNRNNLLTSYSLKSLWPINANNGPTTDIEQISLQSVANNPESNYYSEETVGDLRYFVGVYADRASSPACVTCHNQHAKSPKTDFQLNDVMGAVIVKIPLN